MYICEENNRLKVIHPHPKGWGFLTLGHINIQHEVWLLGQTQSHVRFHNHL